MRGEGKTSGGTERSDMRDRRWEEDSPVPEVEARRFPLHRSFCRFISFLWFPLPLSVNYFLILFFALFIIMEDFNY